ADRLRAMPSVRALLRQVPIAAAPPEVRRSRSWAPRRRGIEPTAATRRDTRLPRTLVVAAAVAALFACAGIAVGLASRDDGPSTAEALAKVPATNVLTAEPADVRPGAAFVLANHGVHALQWRAGAPRGLTVVPAAGRLVPGTK